MPALPILQAAVGLALLGFGQRLFWLFVGTIGFITGFNLTSTLFPGASQQTILIAAIVAGLIGLVLALTVQKVAIGATGFLVGGLLAYSLLNRLGIDDPLLWIGLFFIMGALGAAFMMLVFNAALTLLTAFTGAVLVLRAIPFNLPELALVVLFLALVIGGIAFQLNSMNRR